MDDFINIDRTFEKLSRTGSRISGREFDGCTFRNCDFSEATIDGCSFMDCTFEDCNLSNAKLPSTALKSSTFRRCKLLGIRFDACDGFLFHIDCYDSLLDYSWFTGRKMSRTIFSGCSAKSVNFENADLSLSVFPQTDFTDAVFLGTDLRKADFSTAYGFTIDPEANALAGAKFPISGIGGLLAKYGVILE